ncbi:hypothetical protein, partial [Salipiger bermudensis]|uniref:hypothetical protein n=1 Tax=Salipiger bermudensis TaxID=344736 RepID=UPI00300B60CF
HRQALAVQHLDLTQLGDNVFRLLSLSSHSVVLLFAEILSDFTHRGWIISKGLAQAGSRCPKTFFSAIALTATVIFWL